MNKPSLKFNGAGRIDGVQFPDSHAHLDMSEFEADLDAVVARALKCGVSRILAVGTSIETGARSFQRSMEICKRFDHIRMAVGVHPHEARLATEEVFSTIRGAALDTRVCAIGEIGLDYHYDLSPRADQRRVFERMLDLAGGAGLPVVVHCREAEGDLLDILSANRAKPHTGGVMHCFSGDERMAERCLDLGFHLSFAGPVTFPKASTLRSVAVSLPLERILVETDCPYLAPVPCRGRRNEPAYAIHVLKTLCDVRREPAQLLANKILENFEKLFGFSPLE